MSLSDKDKSFIQENRGLSSRQIAKRLGVSRGHVERFLQAGKPAAVSRSASAALAFELPAWAWALLGFLALLAQNLYVFRNHYWGSLGVPGDFSSVNYAIPFFWITCLQEGFFPQWVPFQAMGYPLQMNMVNNLFYPPFWLFALSGQTYTMHAAICVQWAHVLFGAAGVYFFARRLGLEPLVSLASAAAYQAFGGFYYTAQHDTIVRSYAILPWLLSGLCFSSSLRWAAFTVPLGIAFLITGGYPGALMATFLMSGVYLALQTFLPGEGTLRTKLRPALLRGGFLALGVLAAAAHLLPASLLRPELARYAEFEKQELFVYQWKDFFTFFLSAQTDSLTLVSGMRSLFVTLPLFGMLFFLRKADLRRHAALLAMAVVAALMTTGSLLYQMAAALLPPLRYSRFPCADYRVFVCLPVILLGAAALSRALKERPGFGETAARAGAFLAIFVLGWKLLPGPPDAGPGVIFSALLFSGFAGLLAWKGSPRPVLAALFAGFVVFSGIQTHQHLSLWQAEDFYKRQADAYRVSLDSSGDEYDYTRDLTGGAALRARLKEEMLSRPARRIPDKRNEYMPGAFSLSWRGYLSGVFMINDYSSGMQLARQKKAYEDSDVKAFMAEPSRALVLPADAAVAGLDELKRAVRDGREDAAAVRIERYSLKGVDYRVKLDRPATLVENEMFFPGWTGRLTGGKEGALKAEAAGGLVRSWRLPAGEYALETQFHMPYFLPAAAVSIAACLLWAGLFLYCGFFRPEAKS